MLALLLRNDVNSSLSSRRKSGAEAGISAYGISHVFSLGIFDIVDCKLEIQLCTNPWNSELQITTSGKLGSPSRRNPSEKMLWTQMSFDFKMRQISFLSNS